MFEVWVNELNPALHLVKKPGTPLPDDGDTVPFSLLGVVAVEPAIEAMVERDGVAEVIAIGPFDPKGVFRAQGEPAGPQNDVPR